MSYTAYTPCAALQPFIGGLMIQETTAAATYTVLPGTGLVMGFQYRGQLTRVADGIPMLLTPSGITGLQDRFRVFSNTNDTGTLLVRFTDIGAAQFFSTPLHELHN